MGNQAATGLRIYHLKANRAVVTPTDLAEDPKIFSIIMQRSMRALVVVVSTCIVAQSSIAQSAKPRIYNFASDFEVFWNAYETKPDASKLAVIKDKVFAKFPQFYDWKLKKWKDAGKDVDAEILLQLRAFGDIKAEYLVKNKAFAAKVDESIASFSKIFSDFDQAIDIYAIHSFGEMDGGTRKIDGKTYFIFGIDGLAKYHTDFTSEGPFFHHELFHVYHRKYLVDKDELWVSLWSEGLATYASEVLNPGANVKDLLLDTPSGMFKACKEATPGLWPKLRTDLASESRIVYEKYFLMSSQDKVIPKRAGYYLGYLVAKKVAEKYPLGQLAKLDETTLKREILTAIEQLERLSK